VNGTHHLERYNKYIDARCFNVKKKIWINTILISQIMGVPDQWTDEETNTLASLVQDYGTKAWTTIAEQLGTRNSKQCRRRWKNFIAFPERKDTQWTDEEDAILLEAYDSMGNRWTDIATLLVGRTDNAVKNRWGLLQKRCGRRTQARKVPGEGTRGRAQVRVIQLMRN
jgi:hypothetical protein